MTSKTAKKLKEYFENETVVFYLKDMNVAATDESGEQLRISGMSEGFVLDVDEVCYYLGDDDGNFEGIIMHHSVAMIQLAQTEEDEFSVFSLPKDGEGVH